MDCQDKRIKFPPYFSSHEMNDDGYLSADSADTEEELYVAAADAISKEMGSDAPTPPSENQVSTVVKHEVDTDFEL